MHTLKIISRPEEIQGQTIGNILTMSGRLKGADLARITALQKKEGILFGEAAVALGLLSDDDICWALSRQYFYPSLNAEDPSCSRELLVVHDPLIPLVETFRSIRSGLLLSGSGKMVRTMAVVSPGEGEGKTFIAANLAVVFAQLGLRTLLIDLNFRSPRVHDLFRIKNNTGASSLIIKRALMDDAVRRTPMFTLRILPSGPRPPNPLELLSWPDTSELLDSLKDLYDIIIVDTPNFCGSSDARVISTLCDGTIIVALKGSTRQGEFARVKKELDDSGVRIMGVVMNEKKED